MDKYHKKYYGALGMFLFIIVATAFLIGNYGSLDNNITGLVVGLGETFEGDTDYVDVIFDGDETNKWYIEYDGFTYTVQTPEAAWYYNNIEGVTKKINEGMGKKSTSEVTLRGMQDNIWPYENTQTSEQKVSDIAGVIDLIVDDEDKNRELKEELVSSSTSSSSASASSASTSASSPSTTSTTSTSTPSSTTPTVPASEAASRDLGETTEMIGTVFSSTSNGEPEAIAYNGHKYSLQKDPSKNDVYYGNIDGQRVAVIKEYDSAGRGTWVSIQRRTDGDWNSVTPGKIYKVKPLQVPGGAIEYVALQQRVDGTYLGHFSDGKQILVKGDSQYIDLNGDEKFDGPGERMILSASGEFTTGGDIKTKKGIVERISNDDGKMIVYMKDGEEYEYEMVMVDGKPYAMTSAGGEALYVNPDDGHIFIINPDGELVDTGRVSEVLVSDSGVPIPIFQSTAYDKKKQKAFAPITTPRRQAEIDKNERMKEFSKDLSMREGISQAQKLEIVQAEDQVVNDILTDLAASEARYQDLSYDVTSGTYSGKMGDYDIKYLGSDIGVYIDDLGTYVYEKKERGKTTYYDNSGKRVDATKDIKSTIKGAKKEVDKVEALADDARKDKSVTLRDGTTTIDMSRSVREISYQTRIFQAQEAQTKGKIAGWLNRFIDSKLGGWSKGVPAGICANIFGLEYYKEDGWVRTGMNTSAEQLQAELITNSRTVIIEGEKEEITEDLFRYAYSLRLLSNTSVQWSTYMQNSCTQEASTEQFYDYGSMVPGEFFAMHYAGAGEQDMIFDCTFEQCLYDQACVLFSDDPLPVCVSLIHGPGFSSPSQGSDYDCVITEEVFDPTPTTGGTQTEGEQ